MKLAAAPPLAPSEDAVLARALREAGVRVDGTPAAYTSAWLREAAAEAVDNEPAPVLYARSRRSTRGATRA